MRVIAGRFKGRSLKAPSGTQTRPILDRVKVSLFDWLGTRLAMPGLLPPISVLDMFCGGGSLGVEALSRGAAHCTFVERDRTALTCLRENLAQLGLNSQATVISGAAETLIAAPPDAAGFDLVFLDPPYAMSDDNAIAMSPIVARLGRRIAVALDAIVLWRHDAATKLPEHLPGGWQSSPLRVWGTMAVTQLTRIDRKPP